MGGKSFWITIPIKIATLNKNIPENIKQVIEFILIAVLIIIMFNS